jgi:hypothetical protein
MSRALGLDPGTMFFQVAEKEGTDMKSKTIRNAFVELAETDDVEDVLRRNNWQFIEDGGKYYVIGEDAIQVANIFPGKVEVRRPMQDGVLNKDEDKKLVVLAEIIKSSIGEVKDANSWVCTCVSSESVDGSANSTFHRQRLEAMIKRLGWQVKIIEEGHAVVLSERPSMLEEGVEVPYSGIGLSFGAGRANCVLAYKGLQVIGMSVSRSGDWIDKQVSEQTGVPISQVISTKERKLDFEKIDYDDDVQFALDAYYDAMIRHVFKHFADKFAAEKSRFNAPLDIVVAGGTSMPKGFCKKLEKIVRELQLPFQIKEIRLAKNPRNAVVEGLCIHAEVCRKKGEKADSART